MWKLFTIQELQYGLIYSKLLSGISGFKINNTKGFFNNVSLLLLRKCVGPTRW